MKVFLLSDISSEHTQKWALGLASRGIHVCIFSLNRATFDWFSGKPNVEIVFQAPEQLDGRSFFEKLNYISVLKRVKTAIKKAKPDLVHAHYASSYGMLGALSGFHPLIISVWGADVFDFPKQSPFHKRIFRYNLKSADWIFSTSKIMRDETAKYTKKEILVTPFGVDTDLFKPTQVDSVFPAGSIVVGLIKSQEKKYGTEILIRAFALAKKNHPHLPLKLLLVGKGSLEHQLRELTENLNIQEDVLFTGKVAHEQVPFYHNMIDIFVSVSIDDSESFGVSTVEACSCEKAVIVSRIGGLKEVIVENETGLIVPPENVEETAKAIVDFAGNPEKRLAFGKRARAHVLSHYDWKNNLAMVIELYEKILKEKTQ
jgi:L-malate glycosyltransferase